jgi:hypothetical protein
MSDKTATVAVNMSYAGPGGQSVVVPAVITIPTYQASCTGTVDIPAGALKDAVIAVPFGSVADGATCVAIKNNSGQELGIGVNAPIPSFNLPTGGVFMMAASALPTAVPLTAVSVVLPDTQAEAGTVDYWVFGDPEIVGQ